MRTGGPGEWPWQSGVCFCRQRILLLVLNVTLALFCPHCGRHHAGHGSWGGSFLLSALRHAACRPWPSKCLSESPWLLSRAPSPRFKALATGAGTASCLWMPSGAHRASWLHICVSDHTWRLSCHPVPLPAGSSSPRRPLLSPVQPPLHLSPVSSARGPLTVPLLPAVQSLRGISYFRCCIFLGLKLPPGFLLHL